jgi:SnoaL-like domain
VRRLEDRREVQRTLYQYAHTLDYGPEAEFLDAFLAEATWERVHARAPGEVRRFAGREELSRFFRDPKRGRAPEVYFKHLLLEPWVIFDGDSAAVTSYFVRLQEHPQGPYIYAFGHYEDILNRCADGRWRFASRRAVTEDTHALPLPPG